MATKKRKRSQKRKSVAKHRSATKKKAVKRKVTRGKKPTTRKGKTAPLGALNKKLKVLEGRARKVTPASHDAISDALDKLSDEAENLNDAKHLSDDALKSFKKELDKVDDLLDVDD